MKSSGPFSNFVGWRLFRRYAQFCVVGSSGVIVDMGLIYLMADPNMLGWNLTLAKVVAAEAAVINNFIWNEAWTFRDLAVKDGWHQRLIRMLKFNLICATGIGVNVVLLNVQVFWMGWNVYLANFLGIVLVSLWNFGLNVKFGWSAPIPVNRK